MTDYQHYESMFRPPKSNLYFEMSRMQVPIRMPIPGGIILLFKVQCESRSSTPRHQLHSTYSAETNIPNLFSRTNSVLLEKQEKLASSSSTPSTGPTSSLLPSRSFLIVAAENYHTTLLASALLPTKQRTQRHYRSLPGHVSHFRLPDYPEGRYVTT